MSMTEKLISSNITNAFERLVPVGTHLRE